MLEYVSSFSVTFQNNSPGDGLSLIGDLVLERGVTCPACASSGEALSRKAGDATARTLPFFTQSSKILRSLHSVFRADEAVVRPGNDVNRGIQNAAR